MRRHRIAQTKMSGELVYLKGGAVVILTGILQYMTNESWLC